MVDEQEQEKYDRLELEHLRSDARYHKDKIEKLEREIKVLEAQLREAHQQIEENVSAQVASAEQQCRHLEEQVELERREAAR